MSATPKQSIIKNSTKAVSGKTTCDPNSPCQPCQRADLLLLVVTPSVIPKEHADTLKNAGYAWAPSFDAEFGSIKREATIPVARLMRTGYLYVYYPKRAAWDIWQVMSNGLTRKIMHQVDRELYKTKQSAYLTAGEPGLCSSGVANISAQLINIHGALTTDKAWLGFSSHLWSPNTLQQYADNPEVEIPGPESKKDKDKDKDKKRLRDLRGREISPSAILKGTFPGTACLPLNAAALEHNVVDFGGNKVAGKLPLGYDKAFASAIQPLNPQRFGMAQAVEKRVRGMEKASAPPANSERYVNRSLILMVPDELGVIEQHNHLRLTAKEARQAWVAGAPDHLGKNDDPLRAWKLRSSLHLEMIESWVYSENLNRQKRMNAQGYYRKSTIIAGSVYHQMREEEKKTGKPYYPAGTTFEKLGGPIERYQSRVKMKELTLFRKALSTGIAQWEKYIGALDFDFSAYLKRHQLALTLNHDFDRKINLIKINPAHGTELQQVADVLARITAVDKAWGGGSISPHSAQQLATAYGKDPNAPGTWINNALLEPFSYAKAIVEDKGKSKDTAEKINGLVGEMPNLVKEILHSRHEMHAESFKSLASASQQAANLQAMLVDAGQAKLLRLGTTTVEEARQALTVQVRTAALLDMVTNPKAERYVTIAVKLPPGEALDKMTEVMQMGKLDINLEVKSNTTRQMRRRNTSQLRRVAHHPSLQTPEFQSVILSESRLKALEKQALRQGEEVVEVIADNVLGKALPQSFRLPKSTALNLIGEQTSAARASMQAGLLRQGAVTSVLAIFQVRAMFDALGKLDSTNGHAHTDTLMSVFTCATGLTEGSLSLVSGYYSIRTQGSHLVLATTATRAAVVRFAAGVVGAAGSAFDAYASYAKFQSAKNRSSKEAMDNYRKSAVLFGASTAACLGSALLSIAKATTTRFVVSEVVITRLGGAVLVELIGCSLTGIGIVLGIAGFAYMLYAESLEDDLNESFLKRSYWGVGGAVAPYGGTAPGSTQANDQQRWAERGLDEELRGFNTLSVGVKATLEWHKNTFSNNVLEAKVESAAAGQQHLMAYNLVLKGADGKILQQQAHQSQTLALDADSGRYGVDIKIPLDGPTWANAATAHFKFNIYEADEPNSLARDVLDVKKPA